MGLSSRGVAQLGLERSVRDAEVGGSSPLTPTSLDEKPFGGNAEGLSHCGDESCAVEGVDTPLQCRFSVPGFCALVSERLRVNPPGRCEEAVGHDNLGRPRLALGDGLTWP